VRCAHERSAVPQRQDVLAPWGKQEPTLRAWHDACSWQPPRRGRLASSISSMTVSPTTEAAIKEIAT